MTTVQTYPNHPQKAVRVESLAGTFHIHESFPKRTVGDSNWRIQGYKPGDNDGTAGTHLGWFFDLAECFEALSFFLGERVTL